MRLGISSMAEAVATFTRSMFSLVSEDLLRFKACLRGKLNN